MAVAGKAKERIHVTSEAASAGILALLVDARETRIKDDKDAAKTEILLYAAGLSNEDIAAVMGKKADAVRKVIERNKAK